MNIIKKIHQDKIKLKLSNARRKFKKKLKKLKQILKKYNFKNKNNEVFFLN